MLRTLILRAVVFAAPFALWFAWRWIARRNGRDAGATPWTWLLAAGALATALSVMAPAVFDRRDEGDGYVPPGPGVGRERFEQTMSDRLE